MNEAAGSGFAFAGAMGGESALGSKEVIVVMAKDYKAPAAHKKYKLLATSKTSTMQKELQQAGDDGFKLMGVLVGKTAFGGKEVISLLKRIPKQ